MKWFRKILSVLFPRLVEESPATGDAEFVPYWEADDRIKKGGWRICTRLEDRNRTVGWVWLEPCDEK